MKNDVIKKALPLLTLLHHSAMKMIKYFWFNKFLFSLFILILSHRHYQLLRWSICASVKRWRRWKARGNEKLFPSNRNKAVLNPRGAWKCCFAAASSIDSRDENSFSPSAMRWIYLSLWCKMLLFFFRQMSETRGKSFLIRRRKFQLKMLLRFLNMLPLLSQI